MPSTPRPKTLAVLPLIACAIVACAGAGEERSNRTAPDAARGGAGGGGAGAGGAAGERRSLFPIAARGGPTGYIDRTGRVVVAPQFDDGERFSDGLAAVKRGERWGFIDEAGRVVIDFQFKHVQVPFTEGAALVGFDDGSEAIIDRTGQTTAKGLAVLASISEGLLVLVGGTESYGYVDVAGRTVIAPRFRAASDFHEGLAAVRTADGWGYIDRTGAPVIPPDPRREAADSFSEGLAFVTNTEGEGAYIDRTGRTVFSTGRASGRPFSEGVAAVVSGRFPDWDTLAYVDKTGREVTPTRFYYGEIGNTISTLFKGGLAAVMVNPSLGTHANDRFGFIDRTGRLVIPARFSMAFEFDNGLALVNTWEEDATRGWIRPYAYVDGTGRIVWREP